MSRRYEYTAAVCKRGHLNSSNVHENPPGNHCGRCGAGVITGCETCGVGIRGASRGRRATIREFCENCGSPFLWASRQARIWELQNLLDQEDLDPAAALTTREQLDALAQPDLDESEQAERWEKVKQLAPGLISSGRTIITTVTTKAILSQLGLG